MAFYQIFCLATQASYLDLPPVSSSSIIDLPIPIISSKPILPPNPSSYVSSSSNSSDPGTGPNPAIDPPGIRRFT